MTKTEVERIIKKMEIGTLKSVSDGSYLEFLIEKLGADEYRLEAYHGLDLKFEEPEINVSEVMELLDSEGFYYDKNVVITDE